MPHTGYDIIGDLHGHAEELIKLLQHLNYADTATGYQHESRKAIFLGDFIDRGEHLQQHTQLLNIVMNMVNNGHAYAVMGNHEFNALAYHTQHQGQYLRLHTAKNRKQHQAFLNEYEFDTREKQRVLDFFYRLPLWLDFGDLRIVHACWNDQHINYIKSRSINGTLTPELLIDAATEGTPAFKSVETLLKGFEVKLPNDISFLDKDNFERDAVRVKWWMHNAKNLGDIALPFGIDIAHAASLPLPDSLPQYTSDQPPCFIGHYWLQGQPGPLSSNIACLDYSVARHGKLVAYRWSGERILKPEHFTYVAESWQR